MFEFYGLKVDSKYISNFPPTIDCQNVYELPINLKKNTLVVYDLENFEMMQNYFLEKEKENNFLIGFDSEWHVCSSKIKINLLILKIFNFKFLKFFRKNKHNSISNN